MASADTQGTGAFSLGGVASLNPFSARRALGHVVVLTMRFLW